MIEAYVDRTEASEAVLIQKRKFGHFGHIDSNTQKLTWGKTSEQYGTENY